MGQITEADASRQLSVGDGAASLRKIYHFQGFANERAVLDTFGTNYQNDDLTQISVPYIRVRHSAVDPDGWPFLFCHSMDLQRVAGSSQLWTVAYDFRSIQPPPLTSNSNSATQGPEEIGFEELTARLTGNFDLMYRVDLLPKEETSEGDIGGRSVDVGGQPTSVFRPKYEIQMSKTSYQQFDRELQLYGGEVGKRTNKVIFGLESGSLLYKGAAIQRVTHNSYRVTHTWAYDRFFHVVQRPGYNAEGHLELDSDGTCKTVYQVQPFPTGASHRFA